MSMNRARSKYNQQPAKGVMSLKRKKKVREPIISSCPSGMMVCPRIGDALYDSHGDFRSCIEVDNEWLLRAFRINQKNLAESKISQPCTTKKF